MSKGSWRRPLDHRYCTPEQLEKNEDRWHNNKEPKHEDQEADSKSPRGNN